MVEWLLTTSLARLTLNHFAIQFLLKGNMTMGGSEEDEIRRIQRIREQQIGRRKPVKADKQLSKAATRRKDWSKYSLGQAIRDMPAKWVYMLIGAAFGFLIAMIVWWAFYQTAWAPYAALIIVLVCALVGRVFGLAEDFKHE